MSSSDWSLSELEYWEKKVSDIALEMGLDWHPIEYEIIDYNEMINVMSYHGMPSHAADWSRGKHFEKTKRMYDLGMEGLPYELIINAAPAIAYLMRENPLYLQILIMAHCCGHSDFFKNNFLFKETGPETVIGRFRSHRARMQKYIEDPSIGIDAVEKITDAARAIQTQTDWYGTRTTHKEDLKWGAEHNARLRKLTAKDGLKRMLVDLGKKPIRRDYDLLGFILDNATHLDDWQLDIVSMVRDEMAYFKPQYRTKVINEGFSCVCHYNIIHKLNLEQQHHIACIKSHNQVVCPHMGRINPYHLGFNLLQQIETRLGFKEVLHVRESFNDESLIRNYLDYEMCKELNLFSFIHDKADRVITNVSDPEDWEIVKEDLLRSSSINSLPRIYVDDMKRDTLVLQHEHDGRDLELTYAQEVVNKMKDLWDGPVKLFTIIEEELFEI